MRSSKFLSLMVLTIGLALWTLAPYGGCSCNNPLGSSSGPTLTPTATHGPVVADFMDAPVGSDAGTYINHWGGSSLPSVDAFKASYLLDTFVAGGYNGAPALHLIGTYGNTSAAHSCAHPTDASGSTYPYVAYRMYLNPNGAGGDEDVSLSTLPATATGLRFWAYQTGNPVAAPSSLPQPPAPSTYPSTNGMVIKLILKPLADYATANPCAANAYAYHQASVASLAGTWTQYSFTFAQFKFPTWATGTINGVNYVVNGADLTKAACRDAGGDLHVMAVQFEPLNPTSYPGVQGFDMYIDKVEFF